MSSKVNYNDERFQKVESDKNEALKEYGTLIDGMVSNSDQYYDALKKNAQDWADKQSQLQQEKTDFAIEQIEQQKDQTKQDYIKEQSGAYVDWQKQSNAYGADAEDKASLGMTNTGYSESSQVQMYTAYQNRVATARESYNRAILNYNNAIHEARLQNNSILAEIAYTALQQQLELSLQGFQYKNELLLKKADKSLEIDQMYYQRYQDVLAQINHENSMAEQVRQFNASMALEREQFNWQKSQASAARSSSGGSSGSRVTKSSSSGRSGSSGSSGGSVGVSSKKSTGATNVNTEYYRGALNSDVEKYGAFSNGYQPKGITGHGKLSKTGKTIDVSTSAAYGSNKGQKRVVTQNVWKAGDGTLWYWQGLENRYIQIK